MNYILTKKRKVKVYRSKGFFPKVIKEVPFGIPYNPYTDTLMREHHSKALKKVLETVGIEIDENALEDAVHHVIPPPFFRDRYTDKNYYIASGDLDAHYFWHMLMPLLAIPASANLKRKDRGDILTLLAKDFYALLKEKGVGKEGEARLVSDYSEVNNLPEKIMDWQVQNVFVLPEVEHVLKDEIAREKLLDAVIKTYGKYYPEKDPKKIEKFVNAAMKAARVLGKAKQEENFFIHDRLVKHKDPEFREYLEALADIIGTERKEGIPTATPKYPATKKEVEQELRKAGVPEEKVKIVAPRLATAVWLENQIRALKESSAAKIYGGVPVAELRNLREKVLAKKHVAEKAAEIIENYWMKKQVTPLEEKHLDPKMLPFVREHAAGMIEDINSLAERVKKGELDPQDVRNILAIERDLLDRTHEAIERTIGNPENLLENRRAYGVEDKYIVKREALEKMHRELKPHFETARVKILKK